MRLTRIDWAAVGVLAVALVSTTAGPAAARFDFNSNGSYVPASSQPGSVAKTGPCTEVCSGGGYRSPSTASSTRPSVPAVAGSSSAAQRPDSASSSAPPQTSGFDWAYVAIGGGAAGLTLLVVGGAFTVTRRREQTETPQRSKIAA